MFVEHFRAFKKIPLYFQFEEAFKIMNNLNFNKSFSEFIELTKVFSFNVAAA